MQNLLKIYQKSIYLQNLLTQLKTKQAHLMEQYQRKVPLLLKIAPDLTEEEIKEIAQIALSQKIEGIIAVNTTCDYHGVEKWLHGKEKGGLSGAPLFPHTLRVVTQLYQVLRGQIPIVGVGGIMTVKNAQELLDAGANLVQIYTGLIYQGPALIKRIVNFLIKKKAS